MADPVDIEDIDEFNVRLCRIEDKLNALGETVKLVLTAMAHATPEGAINLQDVEAIGEQMLHKWGWEGVKPLLDEFKIRRLGDPAKPQWSHLLVGFLATCRANNDPTKVIKKLLKEPK